MVTSSSAQFKPLTPAQVISDTLDLWYKPSPSPSERELLAWATSEICERALQLFAKDWTDAASVPELALVNVYHAEWGNKYVALMSVSNPMIVLYRIRPCGRLVRARIPANDLIELYLLEDFAEAVKAAAVGAQQ